MKLLLVLCVTLTGLLASTLQSYLIHLGYGLTTAEHWVLWGLYTTLNLTTTIGGVLIYALLPTKRD